MKQHDQVASKFYEVKKQTAYDKVLAAFMARALER